MRREMARKEDSVRPVVRGRALHGIPTVLRELGAKPAEWFARFNLPQQPGDDALVPVEDMNRLLEAAAADLACPDLGLRLAAVEDATILGPLAVALSASPTVAAGAEIATRFLHVHCPAMSLTVVPRPGDPTVAVLTYDLTVPGASYPTQAMELAIGIVHGVLRDLVGPEYRPRAVHFAHGPQSDPARYAAWFGTQVRFHQASAGLLLDRATLLAPLRTGNETVRRIATDYLARHHPSPSASVAERVARALADLLGVTAPTIGHVARLHGVHPRTLQRQLGAEGTTYGQILDTVRRDTARHLLLGTDLPLGTVSARLGLADQATLTRAVRRWFGMTPGQLRRRRDD